MLSPASARHPFAPLLHACGRLAHRAPAIPRLLAAPAVLLAIGAGAAGCGAGPEAGATESVGTTEQAIYAGALDDDARSNPAVVSFRIGNGSQFELCSGTLVAPNVVLTARHCISHGLTAMVSCDEHGNSNNAPHFGTDIGLDEIHVFAGPAPSFGAVPAANARYVLHPGGAVLCNTDIAIVVLDAPIKKVTPLKVRLGSPPRAGEVIRAVGYGQNDKAMPIGLRLRKDGIQVLAVGEGLSQWNTPLGSHEFEVGLSICQGDSGGPAISEKTGAIVGVVSRGGGCDDDFGHIYTSTAGFHELFSQAFALAGANLAAAREANDTDAVPTSASDDNVETNGPVGRGFACSVGDPGIAADGAFVAVAAAIALGAAALRRRSRPKAAATKKKTARATSSSSAALRRARTARAAAGNVVRLKSGKKTAAPKTTRKTGPALATRGARRSTRRLSGEFRRST
jgi:hypothetical protein